MHRVIRTQELSDDHCQYFIYQVSGLRADSLILVPCISSIVSNYIENFVSTGMDLDDYPVLFVPFRVLNVNLILCFSII